MIRVTYLSRSTEPLSADALLTLLSQCHRNNTARGLTGMLLFGNGTFLQSIEGDEVAVDALLDRIAVDPRHTALKILRRETITNRQFADWSMGFERVTDVTLAGTPGRQHQPNHQGQHHHAPQHRTDPATRRRLQAREPGRHPAPNVGHGR